MPRVADEVPATDGLVHCLSRLPREIAKKLDLPSLQTHFAPIGTRKLLQEFGGYDDL
jgi:hypothetical protein